MNLELSDREFRLLLDMVYIGNWVLNSTRDEGDHIAEYDGLESRIFAKAAALGMQDVADVYRGVHFPSRHFDEGGIQEAIAAYEDAVFYDILAEELARRDMDQEAVDQHDVTELERRMDVYIDEFERHGTEHLVLDK